MSYIFIMIVFTTEAQLVLHKHFTFFFSLFSVKVTLFCKIWTFSVNFTLFSVQFIEIIIVGFVILRT